MHRQRTTAHPTGVLSRTLDRRRVLQQGAVLGLSFPTLAARLGTSVPVSAQAAATPPDAPRYPPFNLPWQPGGDPYRWLENPDDPEVIAYLEAENAYTEAVMSPTGKLQEELYQELTGRIQQTDATVPTRWNGYLYYQRTEEGKDYAFICRKRESLEAPEEVLLDLSAI